MILHFTIFSNNLLRNLNIPTMIRRAVSVLAAALLVVILAAAAVVSGAERENKTTSLGAFWSSAKEDADDFGGAATVLEEEERRIDGGFSTLEGMLQWSIGHSDPEKLKEASLEIERLSSQELKQRQTEIKVRFVVPPG